MMDEDRSLWKKHFRTWMLRFIIKRSRKEAGSAAPAKEHCRVLIKYNWAVLLVSSF